MRVDSKHFQRRFMRRLSIGTKLWIATAMLAAPLLSLAVFYVQSVTQHTAQAHRATIVLTGSMVATIFRSC